MNIPKDQVEWREVKYLKHPLETTDEQAEWDYTLILNEPLASWDVFSYWEDERIQSMKQHLIKGDILFDVGAEVGWCSIVYASMVGAENMVLIEPTKEFWGNIREIWRQNIGNIMPRLTAQVLLGNTDNVQIGSTPFAVGEWIHEPDYLIDKMAYKYLHNNNDDEISEMTLDSLVELSGVVPTALTIDIEGAEWFMLKGAEKTLRENDVKIWVSIHDDLGQRDYDKSSEDTIALLNSFGYSGEYLATDHESHYFFHRS